jgi:hypothetical protein
MSATEGYCDFDLVLGSPEGRSSRRGGERGVGCRTAVPAAALGEVFHPRGVSGSNLLLAEDDTLVAVQLSTSVLRGAVRNGLAEARRAAKLAGQRLRLRLCFDDADGLDALPWEALKDDATGSFLAADPEVTFLRYVPADGPPPMVVPTPLRVLVVLANPHDLPQFDTDREWSELQQTIRPLIEQGLVQLELLGGASERALRRRRAEGHHVIHFVGSGSSDLNARYGCIYLHGDDRRSRAISSPYLGFLLARELPTQLVVFNPGSAVADPHPFGETARTLVRKGLPAVLAMKNRLCGADAARFFATLYRSLASGLFIDVSVANARRSLLGTGLEEALALPVLYAPSGEGLRFAGYAGGAAARGDSTPSVLAPAGGGATPPAASGSLDPAAAQGPPIRLGLAAGSAIDARRPRSGSAMSYQNFALKIEPRNGNEFPILVLQSPGGEVRGTLGTHLPLRIAEQLDRLGEAVRRSASRESGARNLVAGEAGSSPLLNPQEIGSQLYDAIFSGPVLGCFEHSLGLIGDDDAANRCGLRIALHLAPEDPDVVALASLPWELLYSRDRREYLCLGTRSPLVRSFDIPRPRRPLRLGSPLRILVAMASPAGLPPLALDEERRRIERACANLPVEVSFLEHASPAALYRKLQDQAFHVLHFAGHGGFEAGSGAGTLIFECDGSASPLPGSALGDLLGQFPGLGLVLLNACDTARSTRDKGLDPFASAASALVMAGLQAVVAMQFPISDGAGVAFSSEFYKCLAAGDPVDVAVVDGRMAIHLRDPDSFEWATPVLFSRTSESAAAAAWNCSDRE